MHRGHGHDLRQVDFIISATNPDVAFGAEGPLPTAIDGVDLAKEHGFDIALGNTVR